MGVETIEATKKVDVKIYELFLYILAFTAAFSFSNLIQKILDAYFPSKKKGLFPVVIVTFVIIVVIIIIIWCILNRMKDKISKDIDIESHQELEKYRTFLRVVKDQINDN
jgi:large-conductance mechanosensitive channel